MTLGTRLVCSATAVLLLTLIVRASESQAPLSGASDARPAATAQARNVPVSGPLGADYLGSAACASCHEAEHQQWSESLHIKMTKPIAEATVLGDFRDGTRFADHGRAYTFGTKDGKPFMSITFGAAPPETYSVDYTLGAKRYQGYLSTLPDGRMYVLPAFWHVDTKRWIDWKEITPLPDGAHDIRQIWNVNCFNCHATNLVQGFDVKSLTYKPAWTEMGIGCEACHGPGREHVTLMDAWEKNPSSKPEYDTSSSNRRLSETWKILSTRSSDPRRVYDTCAYCHGNKVNVFVGFKAGDNYADYAMPFLISEPIPDNDLQGEFWPDGRPNRFNRPQALTLSGCFQAGAVTCTSCHVAHAPTGTEFALKVDVRNGRDGDELCTQCHSEPNDTGRRPSAVSLPLPATDRQAQASFTGPGLARHTFHYPESEGSRCINCHMSDVNWRLLIRRRDHTFQPPVPENTARFGIPNACTTCHDDRSPEWAATQMDSWWGNAERRNDSVTLADTMYRAGSGDPTALPNLAMFAVDRSQGFVVRASAAEFIGQLVSGGSVSVLQPGGLQTQTSFVEPDGSPVAATSRARATTAVPQVTPAIVNALIGAADDPEPVVRTAALRSLGTIGDRERALGPVLARLVDSSRVVRAQAAAVLVSFGIVELPGEAGAALVRAQDDYVESLKAFPDVASNHASLGWLESERGNAPQAIEALDNAIAVAPRYAFPWVVKGVISARAGRFDDAVEMWKKARSIEPSYPNIDQLIAEAEKRKG